MMKYQLEIDVQMEDVADPAGLTQMFTVAIESSVEQVVGVTSARVTSIASADE